MRNCKQSDIQALDVVYHQLREISSHIAVLNGRLVKLYKELGEYQSQHSEPINIETTNET